MAPRQSRRFQNKEAVKPIGKKQSQKEKVQLKADMQKKKKEAKATKKEEKVAKQKQQAEVTMSSVQNENRILRELNTKINKEKSQLLKKLQTLEKKMVINGNLRAQITKLTKDINKLTETIEFLKQKIEKNTIKCFLCDNNFENATLIVANCGHLVCEPCGLLFRAKKCPKCVERNQPPAPSPEVAQPQINLPYVPPAQQQQAMNQLQQLFATLGNYPAIANNNNPFIYGAYNQPQNARAVNLPDLNQLNIPPFAFPHQILQPNYNLVPNNEENRNNNASSSPV